MEPTRSGWWPLPTPAGSRPRCSIRHRLPGPGAVALVADSLQRTIVTGDSYLSAFAPTCPIVAEHAQQGIPDPLFSSYRDAGITAAAARQAVDDALGPAGIPASPSKPGRAWTWSTAFCAELPNGAEQPNCVAD